MAVQRPTHIAIPARLAFVSSQTSESDPSTPLPRTPLPVPQVIPRLARAYSLASERAQLVDTQSEKIGSKRDRGTEDNVEYVWSEADLDILQSTLANPYRPVKAPYPPGELPSADVIDELVNQVIAFAPNWPHSWDSTRSRLFDVALKASKLGQETRRTSRESGARPGLRRVDSMDFLDETELKCAVRLSASLENLTEQESKPQLKVTPASPVAGPSRQRSRPSARTLRPSLLQRGRSFTAEDLAVQSGVEEGETIVKNEETPATVALPRITRSQSSSTLFPAHPARDMFLTHSPTTKDRAVLALPLPITPTTTPSGWSDSEDDALNTRSVKKVKGTRQQRAHHDSGGPLQSPFEERDDFRF